LLDYKENFDKLVQNNNPFAIVVMAPLKTMETRNEPSKRFRWKLHLTKMLYQRSYSKQDVFNLFRFIDWIMALPEDIGRNFTEKMAEYKEENKMRYVTSIERIGYQKEAYKFLTRQLTASFGDIPKWVEEKMKNAATEKLEEWGIRLLSAKNIEDVFA